MPPKNLKVSGEIDKLNIRQLYTECIRVHLTFDILMWGKQSARGPDPHSAVVPWGEKLANFLCYCKVANNLRIFSYYFAYVITWKVTPF